jgi:hypothetical protein
MKSLLALVLILMTDSALNAAEMSAIKADKTCYAYAQTQEKLKVPFDAFCFDSKNLYFYNKFALRTASKVKTPNRTEAIAKIYKSLATEGVEPDPNTANPSEIYALFILSEAGSVIFMNHYNYDSNGEFSFGNTRYQYQRYYDLEYDNF